MTQGMVDLRPSLYPSCKLSKFHTTLHKGGVAVHACKSGPRFEVLMMGNPANLPLLQSSARRMLPRSMRNHLVLYGGIC